MRLGDELEAAENRLGEDYSRRTKNQALALSIIKVGAVVIGSVVAGVAQFSALPPPPEGQLLVMPIANAIGIIATVIVGIGGLYVVLADKDAISELETARRLAQSARRLESDLQDIENVVLEARRAKELYLAVMRIRDMVEIALSTPNVDIAKVIQACMTASERSLRMAFDFELEDHWTVSVYRANRANCFPADLECVAHLRSIPCDIKNARKWPEGIGVTGIAYARGTEVIIPDLAARELGTLHDITALSKPEDGTRYRSIVGVPILVGPSHDKWGMVVATSDSPHHFSLYEDDGVKAAEAARALAAMIALLLAAELQKPSAQQGPVGGQTAPKPPPPPGGAAATGVP